MKSRILLLIFIAFLMSSCKQNSTSADLGSENKNMETTEPSSIEGDIQFILDKYNLISKATDYKIVPFEAKCDERSSAFLERKYNQKGALSYLKYVSCGEHGCRTKEHYYWEGELIFIFHENDFTPGSSHIIEAHRTYFKNGQMIRCLEKEAHYHEGQPPMEELLKKAENKEVDCTPEKLTSNLSELESLSLEEAQNYFCSFTEPKMEDFSLTNGKLGYPAMTEFLFDINFDGKKEPIVAFPGEGQRGRTIFKVYDSSGNELTGKPYNQLDSETGIDIAAKEISIFTSGGACGGVKDFYQPIEGDLELVKRIKQNMEDGKCIVSTYKVSNGKESFVSKKEYQ